MSTREPRDQSVDVLDATTIYETDAAAAGGGSETESVETMVYEIEETRGEMTDTLGEIGDRLDPGHLVDQAKENVRDATIGRVEDAVETAGDTARGLSDMVIETIRQNPIPTAIAGIGLAWLWKNRSDGQQDQHLHEYRYVGSGRRGRYAYYDEGQSASAGGIGQKVGDAAGSVSQTVGGAAGTVGQTAGDIAGNVGRTAGDVAENVGQTAGDVVERGQLMAEQAGMQFEDMLDANPLAMGLIAVGAGAAIGVLVPETRQENELLGDASDKVTDAVGETASQTMDKVEKVAGKAQQAASHEAKSEGLATGS